MVGEGEKKKKKKKRVKRGNTETSPKSRLDHDLFCSSLVKLMNFCVYSPKVILNPVLELQLPVVETILMGLFYILKSVPLGLAECFQHRQLVIVPRAVNAVGW